MNGKNNNNLFNIPQMKAALDKAAHDKEVAWANRPEQLQINAINEEKKRQAQEASDKVASRELSDALAKQKGFAAKAQGKSGTLLTGSLGVAGSPTGEQVAGQKTLLGT